MRNWNSDLKKSNRLFVDIVYPEIEDIFFKHGGLIPVESETSNEVSEILDRRAGIDFWYVSLESNDMYGIANRVQWDGNKWNTFTVRKERSTGSKTEFEKRKNQVNRNVLYPKYTLQSYVEEGKLLSSAIVNTSDLIEYVCKGSKDEEYSVKSVRSRTGWETFYVVDWSKVDEFGCEIEVFDC